MRQVEQDPRYEREERERQIDREIERVRNGEREKLRAKEREPEVETLLLPDCWLRCVSLDTLEMTIWPI